MTYSRPVFQSLWIRISLRSLTYLLLFNYIPFIRFNHSHSQLVLFFWLLFGPPPSLLNGFVPARLIHSCTIYNPFGAIPLKSIQSSAVIIHMNMIYGSLQTMLCIRVCVYILNIINVKRQNKFYDNLRTGDLKEFYFKILKTNLTINSIYSI